MSVAVGRFGPSIAARASTVRHRLEFEGMIMRVKYEKWERKWEAQVTGAGD